jgi:hypothetical protein
MRVRRRAAQAAFVTSLALTHQSLMRENRLLLSLSTQCTTRSEEAYEQRVLMAYEYEQAFMQQHL